MYILFIIVVVLVVFQHQIARVQSSDYAFTSSGTLRHLEHFQQRAQDNERGATCFAVSFQNTTALVMVRKHDPLESDSEILISKKPFLNAVVGWDADCVAVKRLIQDANIDYFSRFKTNIPASKLALLLADDAQSRSMDESTRPLAYNALLVGASCTYKVDVSGNFWKCQTCAVGKMSAAVEKWLSTRGLELVHKRSTSIIHEESTGNTTESNEPVLGKSTEASDFCIELTWKCLEEVFGAELRSLVGEIAVVRDSLIIGYSKRFIAHLNSK
jgi:20S proteasome alpha/beta subunit